MIEDSRLPTYLPIARAAHLEATYNFRVFIPNSGESEITFLDGPNKGVWQTLVTNARAYLDGRKYGWVEGNQHANYSYTASVEYRILPETVDAPNNFSRVTVFDEAHTLIEVKPTKPTMNY